MTVITKNGHFEVIDEHGNVLCSGDTELLPPRGVTG